MSTFLHVLSGRLLNERWMFTLSTDAPTGFLFNAHAAWYTACTLLWNGNGGAITGINNNCNGDVTADLLTTYVRDPVTGEKIMKLSTDIAFSGTGGSSTLPRMTCAVVTLEGAGATRQDRGRIYLPPMNEDQNAAGSISSATITTIMAAVRGAFQGMIGAGYPPSIYHRLTRTTTPVVAISTTPLWHVMKTRGRQLPVVRTRAVL